MLSMLMFIIKKDLMEFINDDDEDEIALVFNSILSILMHKRLDELCMNNTYHCLFYILRHIINFCNCSLLRKGFIINALSMIINNMLRPYRKKYLLYVGYIKWFIYDIIIKIMIFIFFKMIKINLLMKHF